MNQVELQQLAKERIFDADARIAGQRWAFAYYVAGYAVECALKSSVLARMVVTGGVFQDKKYAAECWTHDFGELIRLAGLQPELDAALAASAAAGGAFVANWGIATQWKETARYDLKTELEARQFYDAITTDPDGVLPWITRFW